MSRMTLETVLYTEALPADLLARLQGWADALGWQPDWTLQAGECWLLLHDSAAGAPLAGLRLRARLGLQLPRYSYHVGCAVHAAPELGLFQSQATLLLGNDHTGQSELADFCAAPGVDSAGLWPPLITAALAEIARRPQDFGRRLIAELAGSRDAAGRSAFWQGLGQVFYPGDPREAQQRWGLAWCSHLATLLPRQTLYLSFLDTAAQAALAQVDQRLQPLQAALQRAGFAHADHVRIDDGGPVLERVLA
ncbi:arginine N-succinyltransferase [Roseateles sp.]|jgi:arginine N-succinyltransferase|uniref:arginine N-succinyltransferase n=1 Tax=Roseateles sp. TaxID=1971397 RepID=UPI0037C6FB63